MRQDWLRTSTGVNVVAIGVVAIAFSLVLFTVQDIWILLAGKLVTLQGLRGIWYLLWAALAALFSALTIFVWRPAFPRIIMALFSASMASHVFEQFVALPAQHLKLIALCRVFAAVGIILLFFRYRSTDAGGNAR